MGEIISDKEKEIRKEKVKKALAVSLADVGMPTDETLNITKEYIEGKISLEELQSKVIDKYRKGQ